MLTRIHVDQHAIRRNSKLADGEEPEAVITVKDYRDNRRGFTATIRDADGNVVAEVVYRPDKPLSCGARVWIETRLPVEVQS